MKRKLESEYADKDLFEYTIENELMRVTILNYGATVTGIYLAGSQENLVLSYENIDSYFTQRAPYLNAVVGPVAGRIAYGEYKLNGVLQHLSTGEQLHHLHGGEAGISWKYFDVVQKDQSLHFSLSTNHNKDGFSGEFVYRVIYALKGNRLEVTFECTPSEETTLNMTSHMYFNLSGNMKDSILDHCLLIDSFQRVDLHPKDRHPYRVVNIPEKDAFDFSQSLSIRKSFDMKNKDMIFAKGLDTPFLLSKEKKIQLESERYRRSVQIETDAPCVVAYTANFFDDSLILNEGKRGYPYCGIALETQDVPNLVNLEDCIEKKYYGPKKPYKQKVIYTFQQW